MRCRGRGAVVAATAPARGLAPVVPAVYNRRMDATTLAAALYGMPGTRLTADAASITVQVPAIDDAVRLDPAEVIDAEPVAVPTGAPAVRLAIRRGHGELPLIVTAGDVVFSPDDPADMVEPDSHF